MSHDVHINIIVDKTALRDNLITEHGLSLWIEYHDKKILFDTGRVPRVNNYEDAGGAFLLTRINNTIETLEKYEVQKLIPLHCTGQKVIERFKSLFGDKYSLSGAGDKISF